MMSSSTCRTYPENSAVAELRTAEAFAVTALRLWAESYLDNDDGYRWRTAFVAADLDDTAMTAFNAVFLIVSRVARRPLDVRCRACPNLGEDEAVFLHIIGLLQRACTTGAELALRAWVPDATARGVLPFALELAWAMTERGLRIPQRPTEEALRHRFGVEQILPNYGGALSVMH